jgi:putative oxidoreductase
MKDTGLLIMRLVLAVVFISHGWSKLDGMEGTIAFFASLGLPAILAWAVALIEVLGGIAMLLGLYTKYAGFLLSAVMVGAIFTVKLPKGIMTAELEMALLALALGVSLIGPGSYTLKKLLGKNTGA